jgi:hypothetical protein
VSLTYPLTPPLSVIGVAQVSLGPDTSVPRTDNPFNGRQLIGAPTGHRWRLRMAIPPSNRSAAAAWTAFVTALRGHSGTFLMGDPAGACPQGAVNALVAGPNGGDADLFLAQEDDDEILLEDDAPILLDFLRALDSVLLQEDGFALLLENGDRLALDYSLALSVTTSGQTGSSLIVSGAFPSTSQFLMAGDYFQIGAGAEARLYKLLADVDVGTADTVTLHFWPPLDVSPSAGTTLEVFNARGVFRLQMAEPAWTVGSNLRYDLALDAVQAQ